MSMNKKPSWLKKAERLSASLYENVKEMVVETATEVNKEYGVTDIAKSAMQKTNSVASDLNKEYRIAEKLSKGNARLGQSIDELKQTETYQSLAVKGEQAKAVINEEMINPFNSYIEESGFKEGVSKITEATVIGYGGVRSFIKPYYAPETPDDLLIATKRELVYINACILQVSRDEAELLGNKLGAAIAAKIAGAATVGTLLSLVSTFGAAGTGTAIAGLSGAAATNATLAWVGSLLGGGMAAGTVLTGGVALAVGVGVYKIVGSEARQYEELSVQERRVVESSGFLIAAINEILEDDKKTLSIEDARSLLDNTLKPLHKLLHEQAEDICANLDKKNAIAFRQHALIDFEKQVINGFGFFINEETATQRKRYPELAIAGVLYALLTRSSLDDSRETQLALMAIRRVRSDWADVSESEMSETLASFSKEQLQGMANNAKGIYHELLFVDDFNRGHCDTYAAIHESTNFAGSDVVIRSRETDEVVSEFQLKASSTNGIVNEHFKKYPDIDVLATEEIAANIEGCESSGINNEEITDKMDYVLDTMVDHTELGRVGDAAEMAGLVTAGQEALKVLSGERSIAKAGGNVLKAAGITASSTALVVYLFG
jgi:hypothetical protein